MSIQAIHEKKVFVNMLRLLMRDEYSIIDGGCVFIQVIQVIRVFVFIIRVINEG